MKDNNENSKTAKRIKKMVKKKRISNTKITKNILFNGERINVSQNENRSSTSSGAAINYMKYHCHVSMIRDIITSYAYGHYKETIN